MIPGIEEEHRRYHPIADIFPLMQGEEFATLKQDIAEHGQREAIWLHPDGRIIDGRNRHRACVELDIEPRFTTWDGEGSLVSFIVSLNLHRRHLDAGQRAMIGLKVKDALAKEIADALLAKVATRPRNGDGTFITTSTIVQMDKCGARNARAETASTMSVGKGTMARAEQVAKHSPALAAKVAAGEMKLNAAYRQVQHEQKKQAPPLPTNKYRVWYADPPWHYGNSGAIGDTDNYGHAERHYPTMTIAELCAMGSEVRAQCETDAVLFLWVTSPLLEECFDVIRAWGFQYKTSFVWDKVGHNFGHYNSVRHELLLICTRGSCTPDEKTLYDSVLSIEKSRTHSEKPEEFRAMIDVLYSRGKRIELFARNQVAGWDVWGNEMI